MGWLHSTPRPTKESREIPTPRIHTKTPFKHLPELHRACKHLIDYWLDLGLAPGGVALTWREIEAYARAGMTAVSAWECKTLIRMSREYRAMLQNGQERGCPPPFCPEFLLPKSRKKTTEKLAELK